MNLQESPWEPKTLSFDALQASNQLLTPVSVAIM